MADEEHVAVVQKIIPEGRHGPYAVATTAEGMNVTFSLNPPVWTEKSTPEPGIYVVLSQITRKRAGWRAQHSRYFKMADEKTKGSN